MTTTSVLARQWCGAAAAPTPPPPLERRRLSPHKCAKLFLCCPKIHSAANDKRIHLGRLLPVPFRQSFLARFYFHVHFNKLFSSIAAPSMSGYRQTERARMEMNVDVVPIESIWRLRLESASNFENLAIFVGRHQTGPEPIPNVVRSSWILFAGFSTTQPAQSLWKSR